MIFSAGHIAMHLHDVLGCDPHASQGEVLQRAADLQAGLGADTLAGPEDREHVALIKAAAEFAKHGCDNPVLVSTTLSQTLRARTVQALHNHRNQVETFEREQSRLLDDNRRYRKGLSSRSHEVATLARLPKKMLSARDSEDAPCRDALKVAVRSFYFGGESDPVSTLAQFDKMRIRAAIGRRKLVLLHRLPSAAKAQVVQQFKNDDACPGDDMRFTDPAANAAYRELYALYDIEERIRKI